MQDAWLQIVNRDQETALPKIGMQPIRRQQLIQATMAAIDEVGLADATVLRIARHAGVSAGIISHYFGGKDGLLEATMRSEEHTSELQSRPHLVCRLLLEKKNNKIKRELAACHSLRPQLALRHPVDPRPDWHANWVLANQKTVRQFCRKLHADRPPTAILE